MAKKPSITIICGHYGTGKTNFAINLAFDRASAGQEVTVVDLDIVNPYFRSSDYHNILEEKKIRVISPRYAGTNLDLPSLPAEIYSVFDGRDAIFDVGGDDVGATALGRFHEEIEVAGYEMYYVINQYRNLTATAEESVALLKEIEASSHLKATAIVNNSHLKQDTTPSTIRKAIPYGQAVAEKTGLPLLWTTAPRRLQEELTDVENLYPLGIYVLSPWEEAE